MTTAQPARRVYDHRVRAHICRSRNPHLFPELDIPRSTALSWIRRGCPPVVSAEPATDDVHALADEVKRLERRVAILTALVRLLLAVVRVSGFRLDRDRLPEGTAKATLLRAVEGATRALTLAAALRVLNLSAARYHAWRRAQKSCGLDDRSSCPRTSPNQLTANEVMAVKDMVLDPAHRHMPLRALALYAQRLGKVFASATTWAKLVRERGWRRPRQRVYPAKPKVGVRATRPDEVWHIDVTVIKLLDGTKAYLHAVIDNYSRRILAWTVEARLDPLSTCKVLLEAARHVALPAAPPTVMLDSGVENLNGAVNELFDTGLLRRILALVEVSFSNSVIESWWRSLRHSWLYLNPLDSIAAVRRFVAFYVQQHNEVMPHAAFAGQTPDEIYFQRGADVPHRLAAARLDARRERLAANRAATCAMCYDATSRSSLVSPKHETVGNAQLAA